MRGRFKFGVERRFERMTFAIYGRTETPGQRRAVVLPVTMEERGDDEMYALQEPFLEVIEEDAQLLLEALWRAGLRPAEVGTAGERSALIAARDWAQSVADRLLQRGVDA